MTEERDQAVEAMDTAQERGAEILAELVSVANADKVYSEPVVVGDRTVITAAEIRTGMGFGHGLVAGASVASWGRARRDRGEGEVRGGGGGGGQAVGRPVAVITIDPDGVHIQPVWDRTRIVLTALTALGAIGLTLIRQRRAGSRCVVDGAD
jgi:uncharacterized spore protein YtfJ